jgi:3-methyladenine DNA glycosylase AlkD
VNVNEIVKQLNALASPRDKEGMARFGINTTRALGIGMTSLRRIGRPIGKDHDLALRLWDTKIHEARILASIVDDPSAVTEEQMEAWPGSTLGIWSFSAAATSSTRPRLPGTKRSSGATEIRNS